MKISLDSNLVLFEYFIGYNLQQIIDVLQPIIRDGYIVTEKCCIHPRTKTLLKSKWKISTISSEDQTGKMCKIVFVLNRTIATTTAYWPQEWKEF